MFKEFIKKRWPILLALLYLILPIDIISDGVPFLGTVDDSAVLLATIIKQYIDFQKESKEEKK
jgi:uncharacterized membrane protein YkvA (DUF1232 family)